MGKLLERKKIKIIFGLLSALVLIIFGIIMIVSSNKDISIHINNFSSTSNYLSSFFSTFILTISSPLTIVFWTSLFATKAIENNYSKKQLLIFGISAGLSTLIFLGTSVVVFSWLKSSIPILIVQYLNIIVGILFIVYAIIKFLKLYKIR